MNRKQARAAAATVFDALGGYAAIKQGVVRRLAGASPAVTILSSSIADVKLSRGSYQQPIGLVVEILVRCEVDQEDATEDQLDDLVAAAIPPLRAAGFVVNRSTTEPYGRPLVGIDGHQYRAERLPLGRIEYEV